MRKKRQLYEINETIVQRYICEYAQKSCQLPLNNCLIFSQELFKILPVPQTLRTHTTKRQILSRANLIIIAVSAGEVFSATCATLKKNYFTAQNCPDCFHDFFDVVAALDGEGALVSVIIQSQMHQRDEFIFLQPWKFKGLLVQN